MEGGWLTGMNEPPKATIYTNHTRKEERSPIQDHNALSGRLSRSQFAFFRAD